MKKNLYFRVDYLGYYNEDFEELKDYSDKEIVDFFNRLDGNFHTVKEEQFINTDIKPVGDYIVMRNEGGDLENSFIDIYKIIDVRISVDWETDGEVIKGLPDYVYIPFDWDEEIVTDKLSDHYGFLVKSWSY